MSYALRGTVLSLSAFCVLYVASSLSVAAVWNLALRRRARLNPAALFALRMLPLLAAVAAVAAMIVPSFLLWEPARSAERIGLAGTTFAAAAMGIIGFGVVSTIVSWRRTSSFLSACRARSQRYVASSALLQIDVAGPLLCVAGIRRPQLLISHAASELLNESELRVAIRHELAHVRSRDNWKKLALRFCRFPLLSGLERRWLQAAELAADDAAASDQQSALELASALLKMARSQSHVAIPAFAMSLAPERDAALRARVERLLSWQPQAPERSRWRSFLPAYVAALPLVVACTPALHYIHEFTELLVR